MTEEGNLEVAYTHNEDHVCWISLAIIYLYIYSFVYLFAKMENAAGCIM